MRPVLKITLVTFCIGLLTALAILPSVGAEPLIYDAPTYELTGYFGKNSQLGFSMKNAGDVNGDGHEDVIAGAWRAPNGKMENVGRAYLFLGSSTGIDDSAVWSVNGDSIEDAYFGISVDSAGDVNNDGYGDVIVGAYGQGDDLVNNHGKAFLYLGNEDGLEASPKWTSTGDTEENAYFGSCVAGVGDVNGDGYDDVMVGASKQKVGSVETGKFFLYLGNPDGLSTDHQWNKTGTGLDSENYFGGIAAGVGDVDKDGKDDVAIGCKRVDLVPWSVGDVPGHVYVYKGNETGLKAEPYWDASGVDKDMFGYSIIGTDIDDNGYEDLIIGACGDSDEVLNQGAVYIYKSKESGISSSPDIKLSGTVDDYNYFGNTLAVGHINSDEYEDLVVGAYQHQEMWVYPGSEDGFDADERQFIEGKMGTKFAYQVAIIEKANGTTTQVCSSDITAKTKDSSDGIEAGKIFVFDLNKEAKPSSIKDLEAVELTTGGIRLEWTPQEPGEQTYGIYRAETTGFSDTPVFYKKITSDDGTWVDRNVYGTEDTFLRYYYHITVFNNDVEGYPSNDVNAYGNIDPTEINYYTDTKEVILTVEPMLVDQAKYYSVEHSKDGEKTEVVSEPIENITSDGFRILIPEEHYDKGVVNNYIVVIKDDTQILKTFSTPLNLTNLSAGEKDKPMKPWVISINNYWTWLEIGLAVFTLILMIVGAILLSKRRKKAIDHLDEADKIMEDEKLNIAGRRFELQRLRKDAESKYKGGKIEEPQYLVIDRKLQACLDELAAEEAKQNGNPPPPPPDDDLPPPPDEGLPPPEDIDEPPAPEDLEEPGQPDASPEVIDDPDSEEGPEGLDDQDGPSDLPEDGPEMDEPPMDGPPEGDLPPPP